MVFHDDNLKRATGIDKRIRDCTYKEIQNIKLFKSKETIPLLAKVLEQIKGRVGVIIELKYDTPLGTLEHELVKCLDKYSGRFAIQSFNPFSVYWFKKNRPDYIRGQLVTDFTTEKGSVLEKLVIKNMLLNPLTNPDFIDCNITMFPNKKIAELRKKKLILGWTVKSKEEYKKYTTYCDNLICENFL